MSETPRHPGSPAEPEADLSVGAWPRRIAARQPHRPAIADAHRRLDWADFEARVARLAGLLEQRGITRGDRVAILLANRSEYLELVFACARIGALSLPINLRLSPREVAFIVDDCRPAAIFHDTARLELMERAARFARHAPSLKLCVGSEDDGYERGLGDAPIRQEAIPVSPDDPMMLMYTSGTTGSPKGAVLPHRKTLYNCLNAEQYFGIEPTDRVLVVAPLFHSLGLQILALPLLHCGGSLVLQEHFDPQAVWACVREERITYFGGVPAMHQRLFDALADEGDEAKRPSDLRFVFTAGSAVSADLIRAFEARGILLKQGYGQTESSTLTCLQAHDAVRKAGSVGKPVPNIELRIVPLDCCDRPPAHWREAAPHQEGEIMVRGPITMLGYWERPEATAQTLVEGWLRTGDLGTRDEEGFVTLVGRSRDMIISGGENVYPAEVEAVYREHPAIREIAIVGVPDARWDEVGRAHLVLEPGASLDLDALEAWASDRLARFKRPHHFVIEEELPRTASGKVKKHELRARDA